MAEPIRLHFRRQPHVFPSVEQYGAAKSGVSMIVSFDRLYPGLKWRASYQDRRPGRDRKTVYLPDGYETRDAAADALRDAYHSLFN